MVWCCYLDMAIKDLTLWLEVAVERAELKALVAEKVKILRPILKLYILRKHKFVHQKLAARNDFGYIVQTGIAVVLLKVARNLVVCNI